MQNNRKKLFACAALLGLAGFIGGCAVLEAAAKGDTVGVVSETILLTSAGIRALDEGRVADNYEPSEEYYLGRGVSAVIVGKYEPVEPDDERSSAQLVFVNEMAMVINNGAADVTRSAVRLGDHTGRGHDAQERVNNLTLYKGLQVGLLDTGEITAFATPGGFVWVSMGMIDLCENEDELAAVICHELGHVLLNHGMDSYREARKGEIAQNFLSESMFKGESLGAKFGHLCVTFGEDLFDQHDPEQEFEADNWGTRALAAVGYNPAAMLSILEKVQALQAQKEDAGRYLEAHPPIEERIEFVQELLGEDLGRRAVSVRPDAVEARRQRFAATFK